MSFLAELEHFKSKIQQMNITKQGRVYRAFKLANVGCVVAQRNAPSTIQSAYPQR